MLSPRGGTRAQDTAIGKINLPPPFLHSVKGLIECLLPTQSGHSQIA